MYTDWGLLIISIHPSWFLALCCYFIQREILRALGGVRYLNRHLFMDACVVSPLPMEIRLTRNCFDSSMTEGHKAISSTLHTILPLSYTTHAHIDRATLQMRGNSHIHLIVFPVRILTQCGMGRFCLIFLASFFLIINLLWAGYS